MDLFEAIHTRRSIRRYDQRPVPEPVVRTILAAAMSAPSACNAQPWQFVVITDRQILRRIPAVNLNAAMAAEAPAAILVCGDLSLEVSPGYWVVDCAAAVQNLLLAAHASGLGAVWTGVWPKQERMDGFRRLCGLPENICPHSLVPLGYPTETIPPENRYRPERVHQDGWA